MRANPHTFCLVDVFQQFVTFLRLVHEELAANEEDIGQTLHLVNVVNNLSHLCGSFATLNVH